MGRAARLDPGQPARADRSDGRLCLPQCRGTSRRSAHATANAVDVSAFILADGRRISVLNGWSGASAAGRRFLTRFPPAPASALAPCWARL
ncbi:MAG: extensin family protein [Novosphingobium sp.]|nr:extensin family protein [Novosphingobium sp.]